MAVVAINAFGNKKLLPVIVLETVETVTLRYMLLETIITRIMKLPQL